MRLRPRSCERACEFVSLALDGELSPFERAMLRRHVEHCQACAEYARAVTGMTELLRATPVEEVALPSFKLRSRRIGLVVPGVAATVAAAVVAVWLGLSSSSSTRPPTAGSAVAYQHADGAASNGRRDWAAGLPTSAQVVQLSPGGLQTIDVRP